MTRRFQKITAFFMLLLVFSLMPVSFCRGECHKAAGKETCHEQEVVSKNGVTMSTTSEFPLRPKSSNMQPVPGFHCPCHLPPPPGHNPVVPSLFISSFETFEPHKALPEVYFAKFIPPRYLV